MPDAIPCTHEARSAGELRLSGNGTVVACLVCEHCCAALAVVDEFAYAPAPRAYAAPVGGGARAANHGA